MEMRIVFFTMTLTKGGAQRVIINLCNQHLVNEHNITIITCLNLMSEYPLNSQVRHICLDGCREEGEQSKVRRFIRRRNKLKNILNALRPDILLNFLPEPCFLALSLKERYEFPMIVSVRSDPTMEYTFLPYKFMMRSLYPKADGFIFQTADARNYFPRQIQKKSIIIPNPINKDAVRESYQGEREKEIVAVGRLTKEKNYPLLIRVYKKIRNEFPDYKLVIYGEGALRTDLKAYIERLGLKDVVFLAGQKDDIFDRIYKSRLFVMASSHEGMPNALMEAMALGLPVVATDCPCGGSRFLIQNNVNGILVENNNEKQLEKAIRKVLLEEDFSKSIGMEASKIANTLNPEKIYGRWMDYMWKIKGKGGNG